MNAIKQTLIFLIGLAITLVSPLALAATTFTDGAWKLVRSGTALPANYATAADCDAALRAVVVPVGSSVTYRCQRATVARGVADPPPPPPPPATVWTFAVNENNTFTLYAPAQVRFGRSASGLWLYSNHPAGVVDCSYLVLGDPEPRTAKWCEVSPASALTAPPPVTGTGTATTTWNAVTLDTTGQPITVSGYRVEYGRGDFSQSASVAGTSALIERLASGTWQFRVRALAGSLESDPSNVGTKVIP